MALTDDEQELLDFALGALPSWVRKDDEALRGAAKIIGAARRQADYWYSQTLITKAEGATATQPDWLNQHARDRGTSRQNGESDVALRQRLRIVDDALTRPSIIAAANAILVAQGVVGTVAMLEMPRDGAFSGTFSNYVGVGGTFALGTGSFVYFTPTVPFGRQVYRTVQRLVQGWQITFASSPHPSNNGSFTIEGALGAAAKIKNASAVAGFESGVAWTVKPFDIHGNILNGHAMAYASRGYRSASTLKRIILILPYGSTTATTAAVTEMLRNKKAAGVAVTIERRLNP